MRLDPAWLDVVFDTRKSQLKHMGVGKMGKMGSGHSRRAQSVCGFATVVLLGCSTGCSSGTSPSEGPPPSEKELGHTTQPVAGAATFGVGCQDSFQSTYVPTLPNVWTNCDGFWDQFGSFNDGKWMYNLQSGQGWWEQPNGYQNNVNSVEFFFADTHGGAYSNTAAYAMWDYWSLAYSAPVSGHTGMRLSYTEGFFSYACQTLKPDSAVWSRWGPVFRGGLRYLTGSHNNVEDSVYTDDSGTDFAADMGDETFHDAWFDGLWDYWVSQDVAVMASGNGSTSTDCYNRLYTMTVYNRLTDPKLTDSSVKWLCWDTLSE
jgi:hypothetical protein